MPSAGMAKAPGAAQPVNPAVVCAEMAVGERLARCLRPFPSDGGTVLDAPLQPDWFEAGHHNLRGLWAQTNAATRRGPRQGTSL